MGVDTSRRAAVRRQLEADYGEHTMLPGNRMPKVRRLPTRSLALDYITGGGYPFGMMTRKWGGFSSGKSLGIWNAFWCAQHFGELRYERLTHLAAVARMAGEGKEAKKIADQAKRERDLYAAGLTCLYVNAESTMDPLYLERNIGLDLSEDKFEVVNSTRIEEIGDIVQQALLAYHVIAVDSTTDTISLAELGHKDGIMNELMMIRAQRWGKNIDWWRDRLSADNVLIYTSQIQSKVGMSARQKMEGEHPPGGQKLNHDASLVLHYMKGGWLKRKPDGSLTTQDSGKEDKGAFGRAQAAGMEIVVRADKCKVGRSHRVCLMHHDKTTGVYDSAYDYEKLAAYFKVLEKNGGWWKLPDGSKTQSLRTELADNETLRRQIEDVVLRCAEDPYYEDQLLKSRGGAGGVLADGVE